MERCRHERDVEAHSYLEQGEDLKAGPGELEQERPWGEVVYIGQAASGDGRRQLTGANAHVQNGQVTFAH